MLVIWDHAGEGGWLEPRSGWKLTLTQLPWAQLVLRAELCPPNSNVDILTPGLQNATVFGDGP